MSRLTPKQLLSMIKTKNTEIYLKLDELQDYVDGDTIAVIDNLKEDLELIEELIDKLIKEQL